MGGGYGRRIETTVEAHCNTIRELSVMFENGRNARQTGSGD
jgi:hypothetical protein